jgi:PAS domain-containing protein
MAATPQQPEHPSPDAPDRSPMLPRNVTTSRPELERQLLDLLDAIDEPVSIATAIRDRDGRILDFRLDFVNLAAARWAGVERGAMIGLITGELLPEFRASGYFDTLREVIETGRPYVREGALVADAVTGGSWIGGIYDLRAIRLGDGYLSTWRQQASTPAPG